MRFEPTSRQLHFRTFARALLDESGRLLVADWLKAQHDRCSAAPTPPVSLTEWRQWEREEGFADWWGEVFPELSAATSTDLRTASAVLFRGLVDGMSSGHAWAYQAYARVQADKQKVAALDGEESEELEAWFRGPGDPSEQGIAEA